jgi:hypothetical protein
VAYPLLVKKTEAFNKRVGCFHVPEQPKYGRAEARVEDVLQQDVHAVLRADTSSAQHREPRLRMCTHVRVWLVDVAACQCLIG